MYFLFCRKNWNPMQYFNMGYGEKRIVHAFMLKEVEDEKTEREELNEKYGR